MAFLTSAGAWAGTASSSRLGEPRVPHQGPRGSLHAWFPAGAQAVCLGRGFWGDTTATANNDTE